MVHGSLQSEFREVALLKKHLTLAEVKVLNIWLHAFVSIIKIELKIDDRLEDLHFIDL